MASIIENKNGRQTTEITIYDTRSISENPLPYEDRIYLKHGEIDYSHALEKIKDTEIFFTIGKFPNDKSLPYLAESIAPIALYNLSVEAKKIKSDATNFITALKMIYGLTSNSELKLYYQPLLLLNTDKVDGEGEFINGTYIILTPSDNYLYYYFNQTFIKEITNDQTIKDNIARYRDSQHGIQIKSGRKISDPLYPFDDKADRSGSTKAVILPVQKLLALCPDIKSTTDNIYLWNSVNEMEFQGKTYFKHDLLLTYDNIVENPLGAGTTITVGSKFTNLSHLCPPSCNTGEKISFRIYPK